MNRKRKLQRDPRNGNYFVWIRRNGIKKYFNLGSNKKKAETALVQLERSLCAGLVPFTTEQTTQQVTPDGFKDIHVRELAHLHLTWVHDNRHPHTFKLRRHYIIEFLDHIGDVMVSEITRLKLERFKKWAQTKPSKRTNVKKAPPRCPNTGNQLLRNVKTMLLWGKNFDVCDLAFNKFPEIQVVLPEVERIQDVELAQLLGASSPDLRDLIVFGILTGLRPKELRELKQSQIRHTADGVAFVSIQKHKTSRSAREPKPRSVPLSKEAEEIAERQIKSHPRAKHIFLTSDGTPYTRTVLRNRLVRACRRAGIEDITPYRLRHTFATLQSEAGTETTGLAKLMGHSSTRVLQRYIHNTFEHHRKAVQQLDDRLQSILGNGPPQSAPKKTSQRKPSTKVKKQRLP